jgi:hypothetical protein
MKAKKESSSEIKPENLITVHRELPDYYAGKRIYCIVANTVQHPLEKSYVAGRVLLKRTEKTRDICQVAGRLMAQGEHVVSKVRFCMMRAEIMRATKAAKRGKVWYRGNEVFFFHPVTTINLGVRDSFELEHVRGLLNERKVPYQVFCDPNPEVYGEGKVLTAIATEPVTPDEVVGIVDYLPLWKPQDAWYPR